MSFLCLELKQLACTKTGSSVLSKGAKTEKFAEKQKVTQNVGIVSLGVP
jgi:hypothetical protein